MIPDQYPNYHKVLEIYPGYFDSLDIILFSYPSSIIITRDYCSPDLPTGSADCTQFTPLVLEHTLLVSFSLERTAFVRSAAANNNNQFLYSAFPHSSMRIKHKKTT